MENASKCIMKLWACLFILLLSSLLSILISLIRGDYAFISVLSNIQLSSLTAFFIYYAFTFFVIQRKQKINSTCLFFVVLIGASILQLPYRMLDFHSTISTFLDYLISLLGVMSGYATFRIKRKRVLFIFILGFVGVWLSIVGNNFWTNQLNYDTITGNVSNNTIYDIEFQNINGDTLRLESLNKRFVLIDCWYTHCRECYKEMPKLQMIYEKYKNNSLVGIYTLHCRMDTDKEDYTTGKSVLRKRGYDLPVLSININASILKEIKLKVFPTVFIFDNNQLVFRGSIKYAEKYLDTVLSKQSLDKKEAFN